MIAYIRYAISTEDVGNTDMSSFVFIFIVAANHIKERTAALSTQILKKIS